MKYVLFVMIAGLAALGSCTKKKDSFRSSGAGAAIVIENAKFAAGSLTLHGANLDQITTVRIESAAGDTLQLVALELATSELKLGATEASAKLLAGAATLFSHSTAYAQDLPQPIVISIDSLAIEGTQDGDALTWNAAAGKWLPQSLKLLSSGLTYRGRWNPASGALPATPENGDYYIADHDGALPEPDSRTVKTNDWLVYAADGATWDIVKNSSEVTSVFGRKGG